MTNIEEFRKVVLSRIKINVKNMENMKCENEVYSDILRLMDKFELK